MDGLSASMSGSTSVLAYYFAYKHTLIFCTFNVVIS